MTGLAASRILMMQRKCRILLITGGNKLQKPILFCFARLNYAFGMPGTLKNALDRTVGSVAFSDKPVALITASTIGDKAHASQQQTFIALGKQMINNLLIPYVRMKLNEQGEIVDGDIFRAV